MKILKQRSLFSVINFLMAFLLVIPLGVLIEQLCHCALYSCCLLPALAVIGYAAGRWSMPKPFAVAVACVVISTVLAAGLCLILTPSGTLVTVLITLYTAFFTVFYFFSARKAGYSVYAPMSVSGILLHILVLIFCVGFDVQETAVTVASVAAIIFFLLALYSFSAAGLRKSLHKTSADKHVAFPAGMQMGNFLLVTGFILIAAFISNIHPIFQVFSRLFIHVIRFIGAAFGFFTGLFDRRSVSTDVDEGVSESIAEDSILNAEPKGEAAIITTGVEIFSFILAIAILGYLCFLIIRKLQKMGLQMPAFLQNLRDKLNPVTDQDFEDETENLFDSKAILAGAGNKLKNAVKKLRDRPQKISDFEDPRMKVRFAYQQLLKKVVIRDPSALAKTPNEIYVQEYKGESEFREFMDYYNEAKYSDIPLGDDAAECAEGILRQKL